MKLGKKVVRNIGLVVEYDVKPGRMDAFVELISTHGRKTLEMEEGCVAFEVMIPKDDDGKVFLFECYKDATAFAEHNKSPLLAATRKQYQDMLDDRKITITEVVS